MFLARKLGKKRLTLDFNSLCLAMLWSFSIQLVQLESFLVDTSIESYFVRLLYYGKFSGPVIYFKGFDVKISALLTGTSLSSGEKT